MLGGFSVSHLIIGLVMAGLGVAMVKFSFKLLTITGQQDWLEKYTGAGSTNGMYKLFGVALILLGLLFGTGFGNDVMNFLLSPFSGIFKNVSGG